MARVINRGTVTTARTKIFSAGAASGAGMSAFRIIAHSGVMKVWAEPLVPLSGVGGSLSGVTLSSANADNNVYAPVSDILGPFTSIYVQGVGASTLYSLRPEMGQR
jgi:hypothetical protein